MALYLNIDSHFRDRQSYPNPGEFSFTGNQNHLQQSYKMVRSHPQIHSPRGSLLHTINLKKLTLPYNTLFTVLPRILVDFHAHGVDDQNLISTPGQHNISGAKFVCFLDRIQYDNNSNPVWMHWISLSEQAMRFKQDAPLNIRIMDDIGNTLTIPDNAPDEAADNMQQVKLLFEIQPYLRDTDYAHSVDPIEYI